jgi:hypothetical protein
MRPAPTLVLDCSRLARIDYGAAIRPARQLRLRRSPPEKKIELRDLNHLVAALLRLLGWAKCAAPVTRTSTKRVGAPPQFLQFR